MQDAAAFILMFIVYPVWVAAGFADWLCHRATHIASTSGLKESLLHWLMFGEIGIAMLAVAFLEVNAAVLLFVCVVFIVHEATVYWDLDYSTVRRDVAPFEQMVHSFLEMLPLASLALLAVMAWPQAQAVVGAAGDVADWSLRLKAQPLPASYLWTAAAVAGVFNGLPMLEETWSCLRAPAPSQRKAPAARVDPRP